MFPLIPFLAWTGGIAAGAQVAGGAVRAVAALANGQPRAALLRVAGGLAAPVRTAWQELGQLKDEIVDAVLAGGPNELGDIDHEFAHSNGRQTAATGMDGPQDWRAVRQGTVN